MKPYSHSTLPHHDQSMVTTLSPSQQVMQAGLCQVTATHTPTPNMLPEVPMGAVPCTTVHPRQPTPKASTRLAVAPRPAVQHHSGMSPGKPPSEANMGEGIHNIGKAAPTASISTNMLDQVIGEVASCEVSTPFE